MSTFLNDDEKDEVIFNNNEASLNQYDIKEHGKHYSEEKFWKKLKKFAIKAGANLVYAVLILYFTLQKPDLPQKAKLTILGALGYFILPIDVIPDLTPGIGFADDIGVILFALAQISMYVDQEMKDKAKSKLRDWFGDDFDVKDIDSKL